MFPKLHDLVRKLMEYPARGVKAMGFSPNALTMIGLVLTIVPAYFLFIGCEMWGAIWIIISSLFDMLDGAVARITGRDSKFGAFFDSTIDRYSEFIIFMGLLGWQMQHLNTPNFRPDVMITLIALVGSFMVSYTRARAEGLGIECKVGLFGRPERIVVLVVGLLIHQLFWTLVILAIVTHVTTYQRVLHVYRFDKKQKS